MDKQNKGTYDRKYYLHRQVKKAGFDLLLDETHKTILVPPRLNIKAKTNRYVAELQKNHQYGVQYLIR